MLAEYIKKRVPGFENSFLTTTASLLGVRESRRIIGEYRLTAEDIAFCRKHDDVIAISNHGYDVHNFEETGNIKWAPIMLNGKLQYVISNSGGFGTTTPMDISLSAQPQLLLPLLPFLRRPLLQVQWLLRFYPYLLYSFRE